MLTDRRFALGITGKNRTNDLANFPFNHYTYDTDVSASSLPKNKIRRREMRRSLLAVMFLCVAEELGVTPLRFDATFYCRACGATASPRTCPHPPAERLELSGTKVRETLRAGGDLPPSSPGRRSPRSCDGITRAPARPGGRPRPRGEPGGAGSSCGSPACRGLAEHPRERDGAHPGGGAATSRSSTAMRSAPTSRRASGSRGRTATPTSGASATWRGCLPATARP